MPAKTTDELLPQLTQFRNWLRENRGLNFHSYDDMWEWSVADIEAFWMSVWDYFRLDSPTPALNVVTGEMPDARWFEGAQVNYAAEVFRHADAAHAAGQPAIVAENELGEAVEISWPELRRRSASLALELQERGVGRGDAVAAYLPNAPEAVIAMLACASIGAIWTMCAPDMGTPAVLDRFTQMNPKALIAADGVHYAGKSRDRAGVIAQIRAGLPSLEAVMIVRTAHASAETSDAISFDHALRRTGVEVDSFVPMPVPFEQPLWVLYSSGTTGLPKAIVHGHGGVILATLVGNMHLDLAPSYGRATPGERFHWYSSTGWVMWNVQLGGLLSGTTICLYDGSPKGNHPQHEWEALWSFAARHKVSWFGAGAAFHASCRKAGVRLSECGDLSAVRALGTTGSPLDIETQRWGTKEFAAIGTPDIWWCNISGGTDIAASFFSGNRELPPAPGRLQCRHLGAAIEAWDDTGQALVDEVGELVCTKPFPSMPLFFWGDDNGTRYRSTYFDEWSGIWRHGDWLTVHADGTCTISGRSDATINRQGVRMGTAEIYAAVERLPGVENALVVDLDMPGGDSRLVMFVHPGDGRIMDENTTAQIAAAIRERLSPRFIPDDYFEVPAIPLTLSGKKQELPIKRLFLGWPVEKVIDRNLTQNPDALDWYIEHAGKWCEQHAHVDTTIEQRASEKR
ncbi:acetoacetate--CoA ligase [Altererythrobacter sp. CAU 1778]